MIQHCAAAINPDFPPETGENRRLIQPLTFFDLNTNNDGKFLGHTPK
jgi:hypothetical protein